jgi:hypothetical protein
MLTLWQRFVNIQREKSTWLRWHRHCCADCACIPFLMQRPPRRHLKTLSWLNPFLTTPLTTHLLSHPGCDQAHIPHARFFLGPLSLVSSPSTPQAVPDTSQTRPSIVYHTEGTPFHLKSQARDFLASILAFCATSHAHRHDPTRSHRGRPRTPT